MLAGRPLPCVTVASCSAPELLDLVFEQRGGDGGLVRLALQERLDELLGLVEGHLAGQRRLVGVDVDVHEGRAAEVGSPDGRVSRTSNGSSLPTPAFL